MDNSNRLQLTEPKGPWARPSRGDRDRGAPRAARSASTQTPSPPLPPLLPSCRSSMSCPKARQTFLHCMPLPPLIPSQCFLPDPLHPLSPRGGVVLALGPRRRRRGPGHRGRPGGRGRRRPPVPPTASLKPEGTPLVLHRLRAVRMRVPCFSLRPSGGRRPETPLRCPLSSRVAPPPHSQEGAAVPEGCHHHIIRSRQ